MSLRNSIALVFTVLGLCLPSAASAQYAPPTGTGFGGRPGYSPYLNLTRGGNQAANYYGLVRPELYARNALQGLQQQVNQLQGQSQTPQEQAGGELLPTGYPVRFFD